MIDDQQRVARLVFLQGELALDAGQKVTIAPAKSTNSPAWISKTPRRPRRQEKRTIMAARTFSASMPSSAANQGLL